MTGILGEDWLFTAFVGAFLLAGVGLIIGAITQSFKTWRFVRSSVTTTGQVVMMVRHHLDRNTILTKTRRRGFTKTTVRAKPMAPKIRFMTADGESISFTHDTASDPPTYKIGQKVMVRYQPGRPHEAQIGTFGALWGMPLLFFFVGTILTSFILFFIKFKLG